MIAPGLIISDIQKIFQAFDSDKDGSISLKEFIQTLDYGVG